MTQPPPQEGAWHTHTVEDRPSTGAWHCGPNAAWVTVTHLPTMISARAFDSSQHLAYRAARACCEILVSQSRLLKCQYPQRLAAHPALPPTDTLLALVQDMEAVLGDLLYDQPPGTGSPDDDPLVDLLRRARLLTTPQD